jgi:hypothetical protein
LPGLQLDVAFCGHLSNEFQSLRLLLLELSDPDSFLDQTLIQLLQNIGRLVKLGQTNLTIIALLLLQDSLQFFLLLSQSFLRLLHRLFELQSHVFLQLQRVHKLLLSFRSEFLLQFQFSLRRL